MALPIIALAGLAVSAGQAIAGSIQNNKARREQQKLLNQQLAEAQKDLNTPYVNTPEAQAVLRQAQEDMQEQARRNENMAAMRGATHESQVAARSAANKTYTNILRQVAGGANAYRNNIKNRIAALRNGQMGLYQQKAQSGNNLTQSGINTGLAAAGQLAQELSSTPETTGSHNSNITLPNTPAPKTADDYAPDWFKIAPKLQELKELPRKKKLNLT